MWSVNRRDFLTSRNPSSAPFRRHWSTSWISFIQPPVSYLFRSRCYQSCHKDCGSLRAIWLSNLSNRTEHLSGSDRWSYSTSPRDAETCLHWWLSFSTMSPLGNDSIFKATGKLNERDLRELLRQGFLAILHSSSSQRSRISTFAPSYRIWNIPRIRTNGLCVA